MEVCFLLIRDLDDRNVLYWKRAFVKEDRTSAYVSRMSSGSYYTAAELVELRAKKEQEIKRLEIEVGLARIELEKKKAETSDGVVRATIDGIVTEVLDPDEAVRSDLPSSAESLTRVPLYVRDGENGQNRANTSRM